MIGEHPVDSFFIEMGCWFLICVGTIGIVQFTIGKIRALNNKIIQELEHLHSNGEEMVRWASRGTPPNMADSPSAQTQLRYTILRKKYSKWGTELPERNSVADDVLRYANCAETLRWHGYLKGRFIIWNERRQFQKQISSQNRSGKT
ncbi:MAG: hypothetical protein OXH47_03400 [Paracoccaceae bacterium]|nr:hypothetical protein [Paracoccaceae bacterium]